MKYCLFVVIFLFNLISLNAQISPKAYVDTKFFHLPDGGQYVEVILQFDAKSLNYKKVEKGLQAEVAVALSFKNENEVVASDAYRLFGPVVMDSIFDDFYDVKRFSLKPGKYTLELKLYDMESGTEPTESQITLNLVAPKNQYAISSITCSENIRKANNEGEFTNSGYEFLPRVSSYYGKECNYIPYYVELYAFKKDSLKGKFVRRVFNVEAKRYIPELTYERSVSFLSVLPILQKLDISGLETGAYRLELSLEMENNERVTEIYSFDRTNELFNPVSIENIVLDPFFQLSVSDDSLKFYTESLLPITKMNEQANLLKLVKENDKTKLRKYLQSYWVLTAGKSKAYEAWVSYKSQVMMVQRLYKTNIMKGYQTDRGRVFLQYGPPNAVAVRETSPSEYPYEIWQYDKIKNFSNKRFVFYNPDLVNNNYRLLHSDMVGELKNYKWQSILTKRNSPNSDIDDANEGNYDHFGGESKDVFKQF